MLTLLICISILISGLNATVLFDTYTGHPVSANRLKIYHQKKNAWICTVNVSLPCNPSEWKRLDGTCNSLNSPSIGNHRTPTLRLLDPAFSPNYESRKTKDGRSLPLPRSLRTSFLRTGKASDLSVTQLVSFYLLFMIGDINSIHDILNYVKNITYCCEWQGKKDYRCIPNRIPPDDPVHRFSGIKCMNLTRPQSFQSYGCLESGTRFQRMIFATPVFDLSNIYNYLPGFNQRIRSYEHGLLKIEEENGKLFPPSDPNSDLCFLNVYPKETRCNKYHVNNALGANIINILFYRQHNYIAKKLYELNPCWDDNLIFYTARDINIAISLQIYLYELMPVILGKKNMIRDGIISPAKGYRDIYDETVLPKVSDEFTYVQRWFHTIQETTMKMFDKNGYYAKAVPLVNCTSRTGFLAVDQNMEQILQGSFRQSGGRFDYTIDYDMADRILGSKQLSSDGAMNDLTKGRYLGFQPYVKYREYCSNRQFKSFSDLKDVINSERLHRLRQKYRYPRDIELMAALWVEDHVRGGRVPETLYCLVTDQLKRSIVSDRHWYERPNRPHAFTRRQLRAIRNVTIAGILCTVGDFVTKIQPSAFNTISNLNPLTDCSSSQIGKLNMAAWIDHGCNIDVNQFGDDRPN